MTELFVLVLDQNDQDDAFWLYSATAPDPAGLLALTCYEDPPRSLPRSHYIKISCSRLPRPIPPCGDEDGKPEGGTIYRLRVV